MYYGLNFRLHFLVGPLEMDQADRAVSLTQIVEIELSLLLLGGFVLFEWEFHPGDRSVPVETLIIRINLIKIRLDLLDLKKVTVVKLELSFLQQPIRTKGGLVDRHLGTQIVLPWRFWRLLRPSLIEVDYCSVL